MGGRATGIAPAHSPRRKRVLIGQERQERAGTSQEHDLLFPFASLFFGAFFVPSLVLFRPFVLCALPRESCLPWCEALGVSFHHTSSDSARGTSTFPLSIRLSTTSLFANTTLTLHELQHQSTACHSTRQRTPVLD